MIIENDIENYLISQVKMLGGECFKFTSPGNRAVPDRIVLYQGVAYFIELKRPGGKPRKDQVKMAKRFFNQGCPIHVLSSKAQVRAFISEISEEVW